MLHNKTQFSFTNITEVQWRTQFTLRPSQSPKKKILDYWELFFEIHQEDIVKKMIPFWVRMALRKEQFYHPLSVNHLFHRDRFVGLIRIRTGMNTARAGAMAVSSSAYRGHQACTCESTAGHPRAGYESVLVVATRKRCRMWAAHWVHLRSILDYLLLSTSPWYCSGLYVGMQSV